MKPKRKQNKERKIYSHILIQDLLVLSATVRSYYYKGLSRPARTSELEGNLALLIAQNRLELLIQKVRNY